MINALKHCLLHLSAHNSKIVNFDSNAWHFDSSNPTANLRTDKNLCLTNLCLIKHDYWLSQLFWQILKKVCVLSTVCKDVYSKLNSPSKMGSGTGESDCGKGDECSGHSSPQSTNSNKVGLRPEGRGLNMHFFHFQ